MLTLNKGEDLQHAGFESLRGRMSNKLEGFQGRDLRGLIWGKIRNLNGSCQKNYALSLETEGVPHSETTICNQRFQFGTKSMA
jgi:hypothetical protein